jgi:hypothetical protein
MLDLDNIPQEMEDKAHILSLQLDEHKNGDQIDIIEMYKFIHEYGEAFTLEELRKDNLHYFLYWLHLELTR